MAQQTQVTEEQARALAEESRESGWDKPSFAKELFLGRFPLGLIHPFPRHRAKRNFRAPAWPVTSAGDRPSLVGYHAGAYRVWVQVLFHVVDKQRHRCGESVQGIAARDRADLSGGEEAGKRNSA